MDYRKLAQFELQSMDQLLVAMKNSQTELAELNMTIKSIKRLRRGTIDEGLISAQLRRDELKLRLCQIGAHLDRINAALKALSEDDRSFLLRSYKDSAAIDDYLDSEGCERTTFYRRRGEVLERFTRAMYGVVMT